MSEITECPNCNKKIKNTFMSTVAILSDAKIALINRYRENKSEAYCNSCGDSLYTESSNKLQSDMAKEKIELLKYIDYLPTTTIQNPQKWDYDVVGIVTGQSVTGTGLLSEFTSSFSDIFGMQSGSYNKKIKGGEGLCFAQIRKQTLDFGGNAVIGVDIDYSEVGGNKGMLMVCMAGTAINLKNTTILGNSIIEKMNLLIKAHNKLVELEGYLIPAEN